MTNFNDSEAAAELAAFLEGAEALSQEVDFESLSEDGLREQLTRWANLRALEEKVSRLKKDLEAEIDKIADAVTPVMEAKGIKSIRLAGVGLIGTASDNKPRVVDDSLLFAWLTNRGEDGIIKRSVNYMTLKSFINQRLDDGKEVPPADVVELTPRTTLRLTREKPKK